MSELKSFGNSFDCHYQKKAKLKKPILNKIKRMKIDFIKKWKTNAQKETIRYQQIMEKLDQIFRKLQQISKAIIIQRYFRKAKFNKWILEQSDNNRNRINQLEIRIGNQSRENSCNIF